MRHLPNVVMNLRFLFGCSAFVCTLVVALVAAACFFIDHKDRESYLSIDEIVRHWGYPVEVYDVPTKDGYILQLLRIPHGRLEGAQCNSSRPAVLLNHGILTDGVMFVWNPPDSSPAFVLADAGVDVFIGSVRGTTPSRRHRLLSPSLPSFWDFSIDEFASIDIPAFVDKALEVSGEKALYYVGYSQGVTNGLSMLSDLPEYNSKIRMLFGLGSPSSARHGGGFISLGHPFQSLLRVVFKLFRSVLGSREVPRPPCPRFYATLVDIFCTPWFMNDVCAAYMSFFFGPSSAPINLTRFSVYYSHFPMGTSTNNIIQWSVGIVGTENLHFDHYEENKRKYGQDSPPPYNYSAVDVPVHFFWSENDYFGNANELLELSKRLRPNIIQSATHISSYNHFDFTIALDAPDKIYRPIIQTIFDDYY